MKKLLIPALVLGLATCGCVSVDTYREDGVDGLQYLSDKSYNPYYIDYTIGKDRVEGTGKSTCWFWFFGGNDGRHLNPPGFGIGGIQSAKEAATFDAVESAKADTLVGAQYRYTCTSKWLGIYKEVDCSVRGFPAFVKSANLIEDRPVLLDKDAQVIRLKNWENLK